jgi:hypothetical protein
MRAAKDRKKKNVKVREFRDWKLRAAKDRDRTEISEGGKKEGEGRES